MLWSTTTPRCPGLVRAGFVLAGLCGGVPSLRLRLRGLLEATDLLRSLALIISRAGRGSCSNPEQNGPQRPRAAVIHQHVANVRDREIAGRLGLAIRKLRGRGSFRRRMPDSGDHPSVILTGSPGPVVLACTRAEVPRSLSLAINASVPHSG